jgi:hypothetical protein
MSRKGVSDVEEGLTKITGITKVGSRGLFVRGLEDRYNNLLINDLSVPSNNPFSKIIPLDLFPTDIVGVNRRLQDIQCRFIWRLCRRYV